jgi:copper(I)-binding protein
MILVSLSMLGSAAASADCRLRVEGAYIPEPPPGAGVAAVYLTLTNDCDSPVAVVGVESGAANSLSLHRSTTEDGIARMEAVKRLPIGPMESLAFAPGGLHVMLHGAELSPGKQFPFQLVLEGGQRTRVLADVVAGASTAHHHRNKRHSGVVE